MMYSIEDFSKIESLKETGATDFDSNSRGDVMARTLVVSASNLELVKEEIETTEGLAEHLKDEHRFQHSLTHTSTYTCYSIFQSVKYHSYNSAYRDIRFLIECWWILRGLNREKATAGDLWSTYREEIKSQNVTDDTANFDYDTVDELGRLRDSEQDKLYDKHPSMREVVNYINERAAHPLRIDGSYLEGTPESGQQFEQVYVTLSVLYAITNEYQRSLEGTDLEKYTSDYFETILTQIKKAMPERVPVFLSPYLN